MNYLYKISSLLHSRKRPARALAVLIAGLAVVLACIIAAAEAQTPAAERNPDSITAVVLKDAYPTQFLDEKTHKASGFAVEMMDLIARRAGLRVNYVFARDFTELMNSLQGGNADVIPSFAISADREKQLDYTKPLVSSPLSLFVRAKNDAVSGLGNGITIGVSRGGFAEAMMEKRGDVTLKRYFGYSEAFFDLLAGHIDGMVAAEATVLGLARTAGVEDLIKIVGPPFGEIRMAMAVREGDARLLARLDKAIEGLVGSPEYREIYSKWYGVPEPLLTTGRVAAAGVAAILIIIGLMAGWRHLSVLRLNRELTATIGELKEAEKEIRFLASIVHNLPEAVCAVDMKGDTISWNKGAERLLGYKAEEIIGKPITLVMPEDLAQKELGHCLSILNSDGVFSGYESVRLTKDGRRVPVEVTGVAIRDSAQQITSFASIAVDISERKKAEEERLKTHMLESIGILAGGMAHDFNNLLTVILSNISISKLYLQPDDEAYKRLSHAEEICGMAGGLCRRLLTYATGGEPVKTIMPLTPLIITTVDALLKGSDIAPHYDLPDELYPVALDEVQMKQVVVNLVGNAKEAMPKGGTLAIRGENIDVSALDGVPMREGRYLKISIHDNGIGIPSANIAKIFDPYYSTKDTYQKKGLGLDLAVCYSIIKRHDGLITVDSEAGMGTTFHLFLPAAGKI